LSLTPGLKGQALNCPGSGFELIAANSKDSFMLSAFTIEGWYNPNTSAPLSVQEKIFNNTNCGTGVRNGFSLYRNNDGTAAFTLSSYDGNSWLTITSAGKTVLLPGKWYYVAGTYDGSTMRLYVNGVLQSSCAHSGGLRNPGVNARIACEGRLDGSVIYHANGKIDELKLYDNALSVDTIVAHYTAFPPSAPSLTAPVNASMGVNVSPTLTWGTVLSAATYRVQVSTINSFGGMVVDDSTLTIGSKDISGLSAMTTYFWRANAKNAGGTSVWSDVFSFTTGIAAPSAPILTSPVNAAMGVNSAPTLTWGTVTNATTYRIQVSTINTFAGTLVDDSTLTAGSKAITGLSDMTTYFWRANAKNSSGTSAWSAVFSFTTGIAAPSAPVLTTPANASMGVSVSPTLTWGTVTRAATYRVQVSTINTFAVMIVDDSTLTAGSKTTTGLLTNTTYFWRANAKNTSGTSSWSSVFSFTTGMAAPSAPVLTQPANAAQSVSVTPTLIWGTIASAATYRVQVSTINTFAGMVVDDSMLTNGSKAVTGLSNMTTYFWRANAKNAGGTSSWSAVSSFTTVSAAPSAPILTAPANAAVGLNATPILTWGTVASAITYHVQVSTINTFAGIVVDDSTLTVGSKVVSGLKNMTTYFWRANAKNAGGTSSWSAIFSFTVLTDGVAAATAQFMPMQMGHNGVLEIYLANGSRVMELAYKPMAFKSQLLTSASKSLVKGCYTYRFRGTDAKIEIVGKLIK
jgi:hypothetical protein